MKRLSNLLMLFVFLITYKYIVCTDGCITGENQIQVTSFKLLNGANGQYYDFSLLGGGHSYINKEDILEIKDLNPKPKKK